MRSRELSRSIELTSNLYRSMIRPRLMLRDLHRKLRAYEENAIEMQLNINSY